MELNKENTIKAVMEYLREPADEVVEHIKKLSVEDLYVRLKEYCSFSDDNIKEKLKEFQCVSFKNVTKDNIHLYYEFMSDEDLKENHKILNLIFNHRYDKVVKVLNHYAKRSDDYVSLTDSFVIEPNSESFDDANYRAFVGLQAFGVKDTLKPTEEYIAEIKASEEYKAYVA
jgi:hypothetical protein